MRTYDNHEAVEVREYYCDPRTKPVETDRCIVPCPGDCVTSHWSEWSDCPQVTDTHRQTHTDRHTQTDTHRQTHTDRQAVGQTYKIVHLTYLPENP